MKFTPINKKVVVKSTEPPKTIILLINNDDHSKFEVIDASADCTYIKKGDIVLLDRHHIDELNLVAEIGNIKTFTEGEEYAIIRLQGSILFD